MSVKELMEILKQLDPDKDVMVWDAEYGCAEHISEVEVDQDGAVVLL